MSSDDIIYSNRYEILADYHQFYLWDMEMNPQAPDEYTDEDIQRKIKIGDHVIVIQPERDMEVPVSIEVRKSKPNDDFESWDHVAEASLRLPSGNLQIHECTGGSVDVINLPPDTYRVRAYFGNLADLSDDELEGNDNYKLVLWASPYDEVRVLKQYQP